MQDHAWNTEEDAVLIMVSIMQAGGVKSVLEIGTHLGSTAKIFADFFNVTTCDIEDKRDEDIKNLPNVNFILGTSYKIEGTFDAAFIDGDHSYNGCMEDFKACEKMKIKLIFLHDALGIYGVRRFVEEQIKNPHYYTIIFETSDGDGLAVIKRR